MKRAYWDDDVSVLSSENVFFEIETAGLAARFGATLIDITLQLLVALLLSVFAGLFESYVLPVETLAVWMLKLVEAFGILALFLLFYGYYFFFEWLWDGQTPGKRLMKLRVMQADGMPISYWHALVRNVLRIADFLPFGYGAGALVAILNDSNRRIGDQVAGTIVAKERGDLGKEKILDIRAAVENFLSTSTLPEDARATNETSNASTPKFEIRNPQQEKPDAETAILMARLDAQDYELLRDFAARRQSLPLAARARLAGSLTARVAAKLGIQAPPETQAEEFLMEVAKRLRGRI